MQSKKADSSGRLSLFHYAYGGNRDRNC